MYGGIAIAIALIGTSVAYFTRRATIGIIGTIGWVLVSFYAYQNSLAQWDMWYVMFFVSIIVAIGVGIDAASMRFGADRSVREENNQVEKKQEKKEDKSETYIHPMDAKRAEKGLPPIHAEARERKKWRGF